MLGCKEQVSSRNRTSPKLILLVEDDAINAACIAQIISQETPYHVFQTSESVRALEVIKHLKPDLFLFDFRLHNMNGIQLYDLLHANKELENIPAIILSACLEDCQDAIEQRKLISIEKPFNLDDFLLILDEVLSRSRQQ
ncbi:MAG: hypothetical protein NVSMB27_44310 [Ktedonobacteraceae bacterium]